MLSNKNIETENSEIYCKVKGFFPNKNMQTPLTLSFAPVLMKDEECAESNEKSILRLFWSLFFEFYWKEFKNWGNFE